MNSENTIDVNCERIVQGSPSETLSRRMRKASVEEKCLTVEKRCVNFDLKPYAHTLFLIIMEGLGNLLEMKGC